MQVVNVQLLDKIKEMDNAGHAKEYAEHAVNKTLLYVTHVMMGIIY